MNQQNRNQIIIAAALGAVLVAVLVYQLFIAGGKPGGAAGGAAAKTTATAGKPAAAPAAAAAAAPSSGAPKLLEQPEVDLDQLLNSLDLAPMDYRKVQIARDPFRPLVGTLALVKDQDKTGGGEEPGPLNPTEAKVISAQEKAIMAAQNKNVTGIIWDTRSPIAVVDDETVSVGYTYPNGMIVVHAIEPTRVVFRVNEKLIPVEMKEK
jgi:hypothetical protein